MTEFTLIDAFSTVLVDSIMTIPGIVTEVLREKSVHGFSCLTIGGSSMAKTKFFPVSPTCARTSCFLLVLVSFLAACVAPVDAKEETQLGLKITPLEEDAAALRNQVFWVEPSLCISVSFQGGMVKVPVTKLRRISFIWGEDSGRAKLTMSTGEVLEVKIVDQEAKLPTILRGMPQAVEAEFPLTSIASFDLLDADSVSSTLPPPGIKLFAKATKGAANPPLIEVGQVQEDGQSINYSGQQSDIQVETGGILITCPFGSLRSALAEGEQLTLTLYDGSVISGKGSAQNIEGKFMDMDFTIEDWSKAEFVWQPKDGDMPKSSTAEPAPGSLLIAAFIKNEARSPDLVLAKIDENGTCRGIGNSTEPTFELSTGAGDITCPVSKIKSIVVSGEEATVALRDCTTLSGKAKSRKMSGTIGKGQASIDDWSSAEFSWRAPESSSSVGLEGGTTALESPWKKRYYTVKALPGNLYVIDEFLTADAHEKSIRSLKAEYKGAELDVSTGCQNYTFHSKGGSAILSNGEEVALNTKIEGYCVLLSKYSSSMPARIVISTDDMGEMVSGESAEESTLATDLSELIKATSEVAWSITDLKNRTHIVTNLEGYQYGQGYNSPPQGYFYLGGWRTEHALLGGKCAVIDMGKASAHIPLAAIEAFDTAKGSVKLKTEGSDTFERLRGFCSYSSGRDDINNYMRTKEREWEKSVLVGDSALGRLAIPILNCASIEQILLPPGFAVPPADENPRTIKIQTAEGGQTLTDCMIRYECSSSEFPSSPDDLSKAPHLLVLGKDEQDDDADEYKLAQFAVQMPEGPTILIPLRTIVSAQKKGELLEISLTGGGKVLGTPTDGSFLGTGVLGETSVELTKTQNFEIER